MTYKKTANAALSAHSIRRIPDCDFEKYNSLECYQMGVTLPAILAYQNGMYQYQGMPGFVDQLLHLDLRSNDLRLLLRFPELIEWTDSGTAFVIPDYAYVDRTHSEELKRAKNNPQGLSLNVWYVHPTVLKDTVFHNLGYRLDIQRAFSENVDLVNEEIDLRLMPICEVPRHPSKKTINELNRDSEISYLTTALDLSEKDLPFLREIRQLSLNHLREKYNVDSNDKVEMFFHRFPAKGTVTLHLHVRVNQLAHPLEKPNRIYLDSVIREIETGKAVSSLYLQNGDHYAMNRLNPLSWIDGVRMTCIENHFRVKCPESGLYGDAIAHEKFA